jgi:myo-inositol-hexaphosphate 3-phosphohydrolase
VRALLETTPVPHDGDAADDAAIWVDTARPGRSSIIATDKLGGLAVYDLSGSQLHYYADSRPNNVDLRAGFRLGGRRVSLVATSDKEADSIRVYVVEPSKRSLRYVAARQLSTGIGVAGLCMYRSARSGKYFAFVSDSSGTLQQWELFGNSEGRVESRKVRTLRLNSVTEGCVADDALGRLYVAQEDVGIWRYGAEASAGSARVAVDRVGENLTADIEGLAVYAPKRGAGYLVASSQGSDTFAVYRRGGSNRYVMSFRVIPGKVDGVTHTDGIAVAARRLGPRFPTGLFVAQDSRNDESDQNFKLVPWTRIGPAAPHRIAAATAPSVVAHRSYYVDSIRGNDQNPGTSPERPWRSLEKASSASLAPGDRLLLSRRGTWTGTLTIDSHGTRAGRVVVGAYGRGPLPRLGGASSCLVVTGTYVVVRELHLHDCSWAGIYLSGSRNRVERTLVTGNAAGVYIKAGAVENAILGNRLVDNNRMSVLTPWPEDDDAGAFGVLVHGDRNEIAYNTIQNSDAFSYDYGRDGSAIELFGARKNSVHHNFAIDNDAFAELGESGTADNTFAYNVVRSSLTQSVGLVTRGYTSGRGPVRNTRLFNNTIYFTGSSSRGFVCHGGCAADILRMRNNIVVARAKAGYADGPLDEDYNLFFGGRLQFSRGSHSVVRDPGFVAQARGNLRLRRASPAVDRGVDLGYRVDFDRRPARLDGNGDGRQAPDLGAFEYRR